MNAIETSALTKFYGKARGINDIALTVDEGDFFGFIGPNGLRYKLKNLSSISLR